MSLLTLRNIQHGFGGAPLIDGVDCHFEKAERVCLIGRNGEGKSTLLKIISGEIIADSGERQLNKKTKLARLEQEVPHDLKGSIFSVVANGLKEVGHFIAKYHEISHQVALDPSEKNLNNLAVAQQKLEDVDGWSLTQQVELILSQLNLDPEAEFSALSGGMKRRVLLAQALVVMPDILLLDEPTNHLDVESIQFLETFFLNWKGTLIFITHDRQFLRQLATRIIELDRGQLTDWPGDYDNFLRRREERWHAEELEHARFDKKLKQEEIWIRQGIKARRTRNEGRVRALEKMREQYQERRVQKGNVKMQLQEANQSGKIVIEVDDLSFGWDDEVLVEHFSTVIMRRDRIGLIGPNGIGKSTFLNLVLGKIEPQKGTVKMGTTLKIAYYDQLRHNLDETKTVVESVGEGSDFIEVQGKSKHVIGYLQDFLFSPERARQPIKSLSGGERNRLLLAKLFAKPANLLVMDEPTNDLDVETLELLEELLMDYQGTLLLVSHDRAFLDNVVTSVIAFEGHGNIKRYVGGYSDWKKYTDKPPEASKKPKKSKNKVQSNTNKKITQLSYSEQIELAALPEKIEQQEALIDKIQTQLANPKLYNSEPEKLKELTQELKIQEEILEHAYERWDKLE